MQSQNTPSAGRAEGLKLIVRPEIAPAWLSILRQDRPGGGNAGLIDRLMANIKAGRPIDLLASRSARSAARDGQAATVAGYLLGLIKDRFLLRQLGDWREFIALGALAAAIEAGVSHHAYRRS